MSASAEEADKLQNHQSYDNHNYIEGTVQDFDGIWEAVGAFGAWQAFLFLFASGFFMISASCAMFFPFSGGVINHRCYVPGLDDNSFINSSYKNILFLTSPLSEVKDQSESSCEIYDVDYSVYSNSTYEEALEIYNNSLRGNKTRECSDGWVFDTESELYPSSIMQDFFLVCNNRRLLGHAGMTNFFGYVSGYTLWGSLSDRLGRRKIACICAVGVSICWSVVALAPSYIIFCMARFFNGFFDCGLFATSFVFLMETTNRKYRNIIGYLAGFPWAIGYMVLPWVAYTFLNWRSLAWCVAIPSAMFTCLYLLFLPESPRWSIVNGKFDQARKTLNFIARVNRRKIPNIDFDTIYVAHTGNHGLEKSLTSLRQASGVEVFWKKVKEVFTTGFLLVKTPIMRKRTILLTTIWVSSSMTYYILSFVSVRRHGNIFWNFFLLGATEIPSYICVMLAYQYCGRKLPCIVCALLSSLCSFTVAALQQGKIEVLYPSIVVIASTAAKFFINPPYHVVWMWGSEIFPTVVRTFSLTFACSITMIFNSSVPHIMDWGDAVWPPLPMVLTGLIGILSAICSAWLPETKGMHMPETIHDIEDVKTLPRDKVTQLELLSKEAIESK